MKKNEIEFQANCDLNLNEVLISLSKKKRNLFLMSSFNDILRDAYGYFFSIPLLIPHFDIKSIHIADKHTTLLLRRKLFSAGKQSPAIRSTAHHLLLPAQ